MVIDSTDDEGDTLGQEYNDTLSGALAELASLVKPLTSEYKETIGLYYLLLLWSSIQVYQLKPYIDSGDDSDGEGLPEIIPLANGWKIFDYGYYLASSPGDNYTTYCTGKLIETSQAMVDILAKRGAKQLGLVGNYIATRAAWMESENLGLEVSNYYPTTTDYALLKKIRKLRAEARAKLEVEEVRRPT